MKLLNRAAYGASSRKGQKRLRVIPILEKDAEGRFHYHVAIEPPLHITPDDFAEYVRHCWAKVGWAHRHNSIEFHADEGWLRYLLKPRQKSGFDAWTDCIDLHNLWND